MWVFYYLFSCSKKVKQVHLHTYNTLFINLSMNVTKILKLNKYVSSWNDVWICYLRLPRSQWFKLCLMVSLTYSIPTDTNIASLNCCSCHVQNYNNSSARLLFCLPASIITSPQIHSGTAFLLRAAISATDGRFISGLAERNNILVVKRSSDLKYWI